MLAGRPTKRDKHPAALGPAMDAIDLPHSDAGPRGAPAVILLHGFPLDHSMWSAQAAALKAAGFRVVVPDLRGFGKASVRAPSTMAAHAADVLRLADRAGLRRFALAGFSMGGYVALEVARQAPERLAGLALVDTRAEPDTEEARKGRAETAAKVRAQGVGVVAESMLPKMLTARAPPAMVEPVRAMMMRTPAEGAALALLGMGERADQRATLAHVRVPTLVVVGAEDPITPPAAAEAMAQAVPGARLVVVPGAAHLAPVEQAEAVSAAMVEWMRGVK